MFCEFICSLRSTSPRSAIYLFLLFSSFFNRSLILDPQSSILHPRFPVILEVLLIKIAIVLSFDHGSKKLFQINQRFQAIEFVDPPVLETSILWTWSAASRVRDSQVQCPKKHIRDTCKVRSIDEFVSSSTRRLNHWFLKYLWSTMQLSIKRHTTKWIYSSVEFQ